MLVHHSVPSMKQLGVSLLLPTTWDVSPSQVTQYEATGNITTSPLDGMLVHHRIPSMKHLGVLLLPLDGMLVHHRVPSMKHLGVLLLLPAGWDVSPSQGQHKATRSTITISTPPPPPGWHASPSQGYPSILFTGTHLYTWVERD